MTDLSHFLHHNIEGYLFGDIQKLQVPDATTEGVGFPLLMTVFSGIEFLGNLLSGTSTERAFGFYWANHLYPLPSQRATFGIPLYKLVRNGIAHSFLMKGNLGVLQRNPSLHLSQDEQGRFIIDAAELADDFLASYSRVIRPILDSPEGAVKQRMQERLEQLEANDRNVSSRQWQILARAPVCQLSTVVTTVAPISSSFGSRP